MIQQTSIDHGPPRRWAAIALAVAAVVIGLVVAVRLASPGAPAHADCACSPDEALRAEVSELRGQVDQLRFAVQLSNATGPTAPAAQGGPAAAVPAAPRATAEPPGPAASAAEQRVAVAEPPAVPGGRVRAYEHFDIPTSAVTIQQSSAGDLVVRNTDPALAGQTIVVRAYTADPAPHLLRIVVPPATGP